MIIALIVAGVLLAIVLLIALAVWLIRNYATDDEFCEVIAQSMQGASVTTTPGHAEHVYTPRRVRRLVASVTPACPHCGSAATGDHEQVWICNSCGGERPPNRSLGEIWRREELGA